MRYPQKTPEQFTLSTDMGMKIGDETLLAGDTVLSPGEQLSVASASETESKAPLSMTAGNTQSAPPFNPEWLNDKNGIVNVGMVEALIDKAGGSKFDGDMSGKELKWESDYAVFLRITPYEMVIDRGNCVNIYRKDYGLDPAYPGTSNSYAPFRMYRDDSNDFEETWLSDNRSVANVGMVKALMGEVDLSDISSSAVKIISGSSLILQNDSYLGIEVTSQGESTLSGDTLTLKSGSLTKTLEELAAGGESGGGDVYFHESTDSQGGANLSNWADDMLPAGWYKVEVMLFSPTDVTISALILNSTGMSGRIKSVQSIMYGGSNVNSGVPYCYYYTSSMWSGGSGSKICRIAQLNFLYKHVPANKIDWMLISDLVKFYGGSVRYTPVNLPSEI